MQKNGIPTITVRSVKMPRITGWATTCETCEGATLSRSKKMAYRTAVDHARASHAGTADIRVL